MLSKTRTVSSYEKLIMIETVTRRHWYIGKEMRLTGWKTTGTRSQLLEIEALTFLLGIRTGSSSEMPLSR